MYEYKMNDTDWAESEWNPLNFEKAVIKYQSRIYHFIYTILPEPNLTQDLAQETFLLAYKALCKQAETCRLSAETKNTTASLEAVPRTISTWLYTIARNTAFSEIRRQKALPVTSLWYFDETGAMFELTNHASNLTTGDLEYHFVIHDELERAMKNVGHARLTPLLLHLNGFSYLEICRMTGRNLSNVKSQIHRAKESMRQALLLSPNATPKLYRVAVLNP